MAIGVAFGADGVAVCEARRKRGRVEVRACGGAPLPAGALVPSLAAPNVAGLAACEAALAAALGEAKLATGLAALAIPDVAVRVRLLPQAPAGGTREERSRFVAWQLRESLPFPPGDARTDHALQGDAHVISIAAGSTVLNGYEDLLLRRRLFPAQVGPASLARLALLDVAASRGPRAIVLADPGSVTLLATRGERLAAWRCVPDRVDGIEALAREVADTLQALVDDGTLPAMPEVQLHPGGGPLASALRRELDSEVTPLAWPDGLPLDNARLAAVGAAILVGEALGWH